ncbi:MAG: aminotransferase class I/II-fold pyridoxal phosphate-dependent enzyme [Chloroflexi bacterium]|nr:MAG: aminotransferase class I/II-fold pyridoxal phosphate-dependent enzyme [Chloroflexota bacterium]
MGRIPPYLFAEIDRQVAARRAAGVDVISLDIGDPDIPTPEPVVAAAEAALRDPANHRYASYYGLPELRAAMAGWYRRRFGVELDPDREVLPTLGSKDGIAHLPIALIDPGDVVLAPDPGYPVYVTGAIMADGEPYRLPLRAQAGYLPDLSAIPHEVVRRARLLWLNYPNNPTAAVAPESFFAAAVAWCREHDVVLAHDAPYTETAFDGYRAPSLLQVAGAREIGIEFHSLSKTYDMTGWRVGMVCGNAELVRLLGQVKTNIDSGIFQVVQRAAIAALEEPAEQLAARNAVLHRRLVAVRDALAAVGIDVPLPRATFYLWGRVPDSYDSIGFAAAVLDQVGVNLTPGVGFGANGEGYFRVSVTAPDARVLEACERLRGLRL